MKKFLWILFFMYIVYILIRMIPIFFRLASGETKFQDVPWASILTLDIKYFFGFTNKKEGILYGAIFFLSPFILLGLNKKFKFLTRR